MPGKSIITIFVLILISGGIRAQKNEEFIQDSTYTCHFQLTVVDQAHSGFKAAYSGMNSLSNKVESGATSVTSTLFLGRKLWKGAAIYLDPEISGGAGLSYSLGVAGALNGETYRIGDPSPVASIARAYIQQYIPLSHSSYKREEDDVNKVLNKVVPTDRITITLGKFSMTDFFDNNNYSRDPRVQFLNWSIMSNGAWDYPANTKGYTIGFVAELLKPNWSVRLSSVAVPVVANHSEMEYVFGKAQSETAEFEKDYKLDGRSGVIRFTASYTASRAPSYKQGIKAVETGDTTLIDVIDGNGKGTSYGGNKTGFFLNADQEITNTLGIFARLGWNDGQHASWAFTEIDETTHIGLSMKGNDWGRKYDVVGFAAVINGISAVHRAYLKDGGYGFILGDGNLNYGHEQIIETYYDAQLFHAFWLSLDYQLVLNPGYNKDRAGPVNVFGFRTHIEF